MYNILFYIAQEKNNFDFFFLSENVRTLILMYFVPILVINLLL